MDFSTTVNRDKNGTLLAYICLNVPGINLRKLLKLVYLIDEKFVITRCFPLTWFSYYAWEKGPVASEVYDIKNGGFSDFVCCKKNKEGQNIVFPIKKKNCESINMDEFSQYEINLIDSVLNEFGHKSADELSDYTHRKDSLWTKKVSEKHVVFDDGKSNVAIDLDEMNDDEGKKEIYMEALEYMQICS